MSHTKTWKTINTFSSVRVQCSVSLAEECKKAWGAVSDLAAWYRVSSNMCLSRRPHETITSHQGWGSPQHSNPWVPLCWSSSPTALDAVHLHWQILPGYFTSGLQLQRSGRGHVSGSVIDGGGMWWADPGAGCDDLGFCGQLTSKCVWLSFKESDNRWC